MDSDHTSGLPGLLTDAAALLAGLELSGLPALHSLKFTYDLMTGTWEVDAQLFTIGDDGERIDAVRAWARALDGALHLDQPRPRTGGGAYRYLEAVKALDFGASLHIWTHIAETRTPALIAA